MLSLEFSFSVPPNGECISLTYKELLNRVCMVTRRLRDDGMVCSGLDCVYFVMFKCGFFDCVAHLKTGDRVLVYMPKSVERILVILACFRLGAPVCVVVSYSFES